MARFANRFALGGAVVLLLAGAAIRSANAEPMSMAPTSYSPIDRYLNDDRYQRDDRSVDETATPAHLRRQVVSYSGTEAPGTIVIDTPNTYLYLVLGNGKAMRYGIGIGRDGFTWSGVETITRMNEWPDWYPPAEMIGRQPYLPRFMAGGPGNPLGARAMYLGNTVYRIHGTNDPTTIGKRVSSGCIRLTNDDVSDLYSRAKVGTKVVVLPMSGRRADLGTDRPAAANRVVSAPPRAVSTRSDTEMTFGIH
jgi:lipoprotein-anchoring transpeptidase ErfK/SrfK